jgi:hypothetical protein
VIKLLDHYLLRRSTLRINVQLVIHSAGTLLVVARNHGAIIALERWGLAVSDQPTSRHSGIEAASSCISGLIYERSFPLIEGIADMSEPIPFLLLGGDSITQSVSGETIWDALSAMSISPNCFLRGVCVSTRGTAFWSEPVQVRWRNHLFACHGRLIAMDSEVIAVSPAVVIERETSGSGVFVSSLPS